MNSERLFLVVILTDYLVLDFYHGKIKFYLRFCGTGTQVVAYHLSKQACKVHAR